MALNVIDISSWQDDAGIDLPRVMRESGCDAVIIKVSGGTSYVNPKWRQHADEVLEAGKKLGLYHYACEYGSEPGGKAEAEFFWKQVKAYKGRFVPVLDWENHALSMPAGYARAFLDRIAALGGATPWFYGYASNVNSTDYSSIAKYPLWMASYLNRYIGGGFASKPANVWATGDWAKMACYQYASQGRVKGYAGDLDLSCFYGTASEWDAMCGTKGATVAAKAGTTKVAKAAAASTRLEKFAKYAEGIAADDSHGYSQVRRWPSQGTDFDCSSLVYTAARRAGYAVPTGGTRYTGTMLAHFKAAGFTALPWAKVGLSNLKRGDVLLNVANHTEICVGNGRFVGAHVAETGGVDGKPGDQTGHEISTCKAYDYPWDWVLRPPAEGKPSTAKSTVARKTVDQLAAEVLSGAYGTGDARKRALGERYAEVQARVNELLSGASDKPGTYRVQVDGLNIRTAPSTSSSVVGSYSKGETVNIGSFSSSGGWVWGAYTSYGGSTRYVAVRSVDGKTVYARRI